MQAIYVSVRRYVWQNIIIVPKSTKKEKRNSKTKSKNISTNTINKQRKLKPFER